MILFPALILGATLGYMQAARRGGNRLDRLQYAAVYALIFALVGLFVAILIERMA
jgi:uncharacterized membrane protein SpoIIM required for sporulation